jgi:hypothetical protein
VKRGKPTLWRCETGQAHVSTTTATEFVIRCHTVDVSAAK